jgi:hypothetical protein
MEPGSDPKFKVCCTASGHDKSLRLWERSEKVLVLHDERETEREREGRKVMPSWRRATAAEPSREMRTTRRQRSRLRTLLNAIKVQRDLWNFTKVQGRGGRGCGRDCGYREGGACTLTAPFHNGVSCLRRPKTL